MNNPPAASPVTWRTTLAARLWRLAGQAAPPALAVWLRLRARRGREDPARLDERRGGGPPPPAHWPASRHRVWLHAASVGETVSLLPVIDELLARPGVSVLVTTATLGGAQTLARRTDADQVAHRYVPHDVPRWIARFLDGWQPTAAGFVDSEIWPNTLAALRRRGTPAMLINGRISARSARRWAIAMRLFGATPLRLFDHVAARDAEDAGRLAALGAPKAMLVGDLKQAAAPLPCDAGLLAELRARLGPRPVWLAAATHPGEEAAIAVAHRRLLARHPRLLTLVAPRHPPRGPAVAAALGAGRRGARDALPEAAGLYVWDTLGEMGLLYRLAPVVFIGNSLGPGPGGGHNPYEPARCGAALATGPSTGNFAPAIAALAAAGAIVIVPDADALAGWVGAMFADPAERLRRAAAARDAAQARARDAGDLAGRIAAALIGETR